MSRLGATLTWCVIAGGALMFSTAVAQDDIEDPDAYPGAWYRIAFDDNGDYLHGDGHGYAGGTWYYYPETGWWRQWFYNEPYDPCRVGELEYQLYIKAMDPARTTFLEVRFNWSTPQWSSLGKRHPPLPSDVPTGTPEFTYMTGRDLYTVDDYRIVGSVEPIKSYTVTDYNPEWVSIDIRGRNAYVYRGAFHACLPKDIFMGACFDPQTGDCYTTHRFDCLAPYEWLGAGSSCADCLEPGPFPVPVYRFWSGPRRAHFFTRSERERTKLLEDYADIWTEEGVAYYAFSDDAEVESRPVHRFWSSTLGVHFYTMSESEKQKLLANYAHVWTYEGPAFYAYPQEAPPADSLPVFRFWSDTLKYHFYTLRESEKNKLVNDYPYVWTYEGVAWYAYAP